MVISTGSRHSLLSQLLHQDLVKRPVMMMVRLPDVNGQKLRFALDLHLSTPCLSDLPGQDYSSEGGRQAPEEAGRHIDGRDQVDSLSQ